MRYTEALQLLLCVAGIYAAYLTQGLVNEHLQTKRFGAAQERFVHLESLNGAQSVACFVWAWALLQLLRLRQRGSEPKGMTPPWWVYWKPAVTNSIGPACGMIALRNISYPAQVLAKSCKMVPVMAVGTLLHGKRYSPLEYLCMSLIGAGISLFAKRSSSKVTSKLAAPNAPLGYSLCVANLVLDGYTNAAQDEINRKYPSNRPLHMMCWMNFWTAAYYAVYMFGFSSSGGDIIRFCARHADAAGDVLLFCLCGALGQLFIFYTIKTFGSLANTLVCTTRKFFNILGSVLLNGNPLLLVQWAAVAMVFGGLLTSTVVKAKKHQSRKQQ